MILRTIWVILITARAGVLFSIPGLQGWGYVHLGGTLIGLIIRARHIVND